MTKIFDPKVLGEIARKGVGLPTDEMFATVHQELIKEYPGRIRENTRWIFNIAGGAMGQLQVLYGSCTEYLIFFGSPIGTEGHSGRYGAEVYDWIMKGEIWTYIEGETERSVYGPGQEAYLGRGKAKGYCIKDHAWMLEYGRGNIWFMLPFGVIASNAFNTLDYMVVLRTLRDFTPKVIRELLKGKI